MRAQASMEYLTVYSFAIVVILGMVTTFAFLNSDPMDRVPSDCRFGTEIECVDHTFTLSSSGGASPGLNLVLVNRAETLYEVSLVCTYKNGEETTGTTVNPVNLGEEFFVNCGLPTNNPAIDEKIKVNVELRYNLNLTTVKNWRTFDGVVISVVRE